MDELRMVGKWWLPTAPTAPVGGVLEIDANGRSRLELTDSLLGNMDAQVVHGAADGRQVTLLECQPANGGKITMGQEHTVVEVVQPRVVLVGIHLESAEDEAFDGLEVEMANLTAWTRRSGINRTDVFKGSEDGSDKLTFARVVVEPSVLEKVLARLEDAGETATLGWTLKWNTATEAWERAFTVKELATVTVRADEKRTWRGFNETVSAVRDLVTLATQVGCRVGKKTLLVREAEKGEGTRDYPVGLYFDAGSGDERAVSPHDIIFTLDDVDWGMLLPAWVALRKKVGLPLDVLFSLDYNRGDFYQNQIFNAASATEGFHAALRPESIGIPDELYQEVKTTARALFPENPAARDWIRGRTGDNRPGLKQRILEIAEIPDQTAVEKLLTDVDMWAKWLKDARNALGHLNTGELEAKVPEQARYRLTYLTKALLHLVLMQELGLSAATQQKAVENNFGYSARAFGEVVRAAKK
ncbi:HEPN domain-containing protein [Rhodococcus sp. NPDC057529]|uniref:ApeA N-terminal domain 1-containing protein n=1 Tax=Rhodococcus sp. NPDC057529 TaxID=3346158 RepID=UPI00366D21CE